MLSPAYTIKYQSLSGWQIADRPRENEKNRRLKYHIKNQDYFGTLATVLDLLDQFSRNEIDKMLKFEKERSDKIKEIKEDLLVLQKVYKVVKK